MTQEERKLLLTDLCARLPYGVKCAIFDKKIEFGGFDGKYPFILDGITVEVDGVDVWLEKANFSLETIKPYLRPMSSMTKEERKYISDRCGFSISGPIRNECELIMPVLVADWLIDFYNEHHIDYRGLIEKGLALEAPKDMYND